MIWNEGELKANPYEPLVNNSSDNRNWIYTFCGSIRTWVICTWVLVAAGVVLFAFAIELGFRHGSGNLPDHLASAGLYMLVISGLGSFLTTIYCIAYFKAQAGLWAWLSIATTTLGAVVSAYVWASV